ncbi:Tubulin/FtsZ, GTPase domain-containing protein [Ochromonadaceae sp. CCMP2298]|nr:Tubulin/FtsZ, GTPase domain-containing protein [Ochromonadaceae sp. CCMP2298]
MSRQGDILTLQVGNTANYVGAHMWNSRDEMRQLHGEASTSALYHTGKTTHYPRCVIIDAPSNLGQIYPAEPEAADAGIWGGALKSYDTPVATKVCVQDQPGYHSKHGALFWSDFLKPELHRKAVCELPKWSCGQYFDSFHKGLLGSGTNDTLTAEYLEQVVDRCRYFAEACDRFATVEVLTQPGEGPAGLTASLLPLLREEFGGICMPVWSMGSEMGLADLHAEGMKNKLDVLDNALFYSSVVEHCDALVPLSSQRIRQSIGQEMSSQYSNYVCTAAAALAIDTAAVYQTPTLDVPPVPRGLGSSEQACLEDARMRADIRQARLRESDSLEHPAASVRIESAHHWCATVTQRGRHPVCFLEATFPGVLENAEKAEDLAGYAGLEQYLLDSFDVSRAHLSAVAHKKGWGGRLSTGNPFTVSLSPTTYLGCGSGDEGGSGSGSVDPAFPYQKMYSNVLSIRGLGGQEVRSSLFRQCQQHPYRIHVCQANAMPLYAANSSPFNSAEHVEDGDAGTGCVLNEGLEMAAAVGASALVGEFLEQQAYLWQAGSSMQALAVQLAKAGQDQAEAAEVTEALLTLAQRYVE